MRLLLTLCTVLTLCSTAFAQNNTWYVDPINGINTNTGDTPSQALLSIRAALINTLLSSGDTILLAGGIYNDATGITTSGNLDEVFPIVIPSGVSLRAGNAFDPPVIDGNSTGGLAPVLFEVEESILTTTYIDGVEMMNCLTAIATDNVGQTPAVNGLVIEGYTISGYAATGISLQLISGSSDLVVIRDCTITGTSATDFGIFITTEGTNQVLSGGAIQDCTITGNVRGIYVASGANGSVGSAFKIIRNVVSGFSGHGIHTAATTFESQFSGVMRGNVVTGDGVSGTGDICIVMEATLASSGFLCTNNGLVTYNDCSLADINVQCKATPVNGSGAVVSCAFVGNVIRNATNYGVQLLFTSGIGTGLQPDFGTGSGFAGRNTLNNPSALAEVQLASGMSNSVHLTGNFWPDAGSNAQARIDTNGAPSATISSILSETLVGVLDVAVIKPSIGRALTIVVSEGAVVVQLDELGVADIKAAAGTFGQYKLFTLTGANGSVSIAPTELLSVSPDGSNIAFNVPALEAGNYTIHFTNPGFQSLTPIGLKVTSGSSGGGGGGGGSGCVVATAAHGDYNAPEVRILRQFRDQYLVPRSGGRTLVRGYYKHGEPVAEYIASNEWARKATRTALAPTTAIAYTLVNWNTGQRFLMAVVLLGMFLKLAFGGRK
ncbi:MAG: hypothetical protein HQ519_13585 [Planctomycetes bacterium]|nr:hypothetical protein [Planctomycetota bacterium]